MAVRRGAQAILNNMIPQILLTVTPPQVALPAWERSQRPRVSS